MKKYTMSADLKKRLNAAVSELNQLGISGGLYRYKAKECSCCYGLKGVSFEINENIPGNWGIYGTGEGYHKAIFAELADARAIYFCLRLHLEGSGWRVEWEGSEHKAIMIEKNV